MTDHAVIEVIERRWSTAHDRGAHDYTDEGCRILAERAFKDVPILLAHIEELREMLYKAGSWPGGHR
jgi:hypothetical protein